LTEAAHRFFESWHLCNYYSGLEDAEKLPPLSCRITPEDEQQVACRALPKSATVVHLNDNKIIAVR